MPMMMKKLLSTDITTVCINIFSVAWNNQQKYKAKKKADTCLYNIYPDFYKQMQWNLSKLNFCVCNRQLFSLYRLN
jgi:hypothetical protein